MPAYVKVSAAWRSVTNLYVKVGTTGGPFSNGWRTVTDGYVKVGTTGGPFSNGWRRIFSSVLTPSIASTVTISRNNATLPSTLTGTNYFWSNSTSLTYVFQKSSDNVNFTNIGSATSINNPSSGSSNTVTYALTLSDFPAFTSYFRFVVTAVNSTFSTSATSTSSSVSVNRPAPINTVAPTISPSSGTVGVTQYSVTSNGTWDPVDADGVYQYLWQSFDTPTYVSAPGTNNLSTYTPPSDFLTSGYLSPIRCRVTAVNASGSTAAFSNTATVSAVTPTASDLATSDTTITPGTPSSITVANTATTNQGQVTWANGSNATSAWVSSVTPGSSFTGTDGGSLLTSQLFTITSSATAVATVNNKNNNKRVTISWNQSNAASYRVNYTITNAGLANGTFNQDGNSTASSASFTITLGNVAGTVRANSVTVYSSANQSGVSSTFTPGSAPQTTPTDKTSSNTGSGSVTFVAPPATPTITYSNVTFSSFTVSWSSSGATSYNVSVFESVSGNSVFSASGTTATVVSPSGLQPNRSYSTTVTAINAAGNATNTVSQTTPFGPALTPTFGANTSVSGGFTGSVTNFDANYTFGISTSVGSVSFSSPSGSTRAFTVSGLSSGQSATVTVTTSRTNYNSGSAQTIGSATLVQYTVTWNANGGTVSPTSSTVNAGIAINPTPIPTRSGFTFSFWRNPLSGGDPIIISPGASYTPTANITFFAIWTSATTVPGIVNSLTASSLLTGTNLDWSASWSAPTDNGGSAITGYRIYVERAGSSTGPWLATTTQSPAGTGAFTQASPRLVSSATTSVTGRVTGTSATWIRVWVAAVNVIGTGSYTSAVG